MMRIALFALVLLGAIISTADAGRAFSNNDANYLSTTVLPCTGYPCSVVARFNPGTLPSNNEGIFVEGSTTSFTKSNVRLYFGGSGGASPQTLSGEVNHTNPCTATTTSALNTWHDGVAVFPSAATGCTIYVDGGNSATNATGAAFDPSINIAIIGADQENTFGFPFNGNLADEAVYPCSLTSGDATTVHNSPGIPLNKLSLSCAPSAYWPLYGYSSPEPDFSANRNAMSITGSVPYAAGPWPIPVLGGN